MGNELYIRLFGRVELVSGESSAYQFPTQKCQELAAFLTLAHGKTMPRDAVCRALWPDDPVSGSIRNRLSVTTYMLRRECQLNGIPLEQCLVTDRQTMSINSAATSDYQEFVASAKLLRELTEDSCKIHHAERVVELYRGPLADGIRAPWLTALRAEARQMFRDAVMILARLQDPERAKETIHNATLVDLDDDGAVPTFLNCMADQGAWETVEEILTKLEASTSTRARRMATEFRRSHTETRDAAVPCVIAVACVVDETGRNGLAECSARSGFLVKHEDYALFANPSSALKSAEDILRGAPGAKVSLHLVAMDPNSTLPEHVRQQHAGASPGNVWLHGAVQELLTESSGPCVGE